MTFKKEGNAFAVQRQKVTAAKSYSRKKSQRYLRLSIKTKTVPVPPTNKAVNGIFKKKN
jgi:hypothetical protein